jgi:hypothetical protein
LLFCAPRAEAIMILARAARKTKSLRYAQTKKVAMRANKKENLIT